MSKKVFVSGCFDLLHSGHIAFLQEAAGYGDLYVALGSDATVYSLKGRAPVNTEDERLYMVRSLSCVTDAFVSTGSGILDFENELRAMQPDLFIVNADGNTPQKEALCREVGVEYLVLERKPHENLPPRSSTALRATELMPYRIDVAGGWLDQPFVSRLHPGPVLTISLEPTISFNERSGMATSTRNSALELWGPKLPIGDPEQLAKILFRYDNPPGKSHISGSQDAIGLVCPALNRAHYTGDYWPSVIEHVNDEETLQFVEQALYLVPLGPREDGFDPLHNTNLTYDNARALAVAAEGCWQAILARDLAGFGQHFRESFEAQIALFTNMMTPGVRRMIDQYCNQALGWKLSGAGGGGYLTLVAAQPIPKAVQIKIRRAAP